MVTKILRNTDRTMGIDLYPLVGRGTVLILPNKRNSSCTQLREVH